MQHAGHGWTSLEQVKDALEDEEDFYALFTHEDEGDFMDSGTLSDCSKPGTEG